MRRLVVLSVLGFSLLLAACQTTPQQQARIAPRETGIEGSWGSTGGPVPYTARFVSGRFTSTENATGATLADGSYTKTSSSSASIIYRRPSGGSEVSVNCNQMSADRLACVNSSGARFELARRA